MLTIDGSRGEGGGQILRTTLALAVIHQTPVQITRIRAGRGRPGLMRQHLTAVHAAARISHAEVTGAQIGSSEIVFRPKDLTAGQYTFAVGTAGSATLVLQTILPALLCAKGPSQLTLEGGTHNPGAPPFDFLQKAFLPLIQRMGPDIQAVLDQRGFYPAGGGRFHIDVSPASSLARLDLNERGSILDQRGIATIANLPAHIATREIQTASRLLNWNTSCFIEDIVNDARGPGNVFTIEVISEHVTEVFTGFGEKGVRAEVVAERVGMAAMNYMDAGVPVGEHLADQLLLPMALGNGGSFRTTEPSLHTRTHADLIDQILGVKVSLEQITENVWQVDVGGRQQSKPEEGA